RLPPWQGYATLRAEHGGGPKRIDDGSGLGDAGGRRSPGGHRAARGRASSAAAARAPHAAGRAALRRGPRKALRERRPDRAGTPPNTGVTGASTQRTAPGRPSRARICTQQAEAGARPAAPAGATEPTGRPGYCVVVRSNSSASWTALAVAFFSSSNAARPRWTVTWGYLGWKDLTMSSSRGSASTSDPP